MEGSTVRFDAPYVHHRPEKGMITIARAGALGRGRKDEPAEAAPTTPGTLPRIQRTEKKGNCSDCNRGTHLLWTSPNIDYRLCQGCAKKRGGAYRETIKNFVISV